jgi:hypothetical protein
MGVMVAALLTLPAVAVTPAAARKHHSVHFVTWAVKALGSSQYQHTRGKVFRHCKSAPTGDVVADFRGHGLKPRDQVTGTWFLNGHRYSSHTFRWGHGKGNIFNFALRSSDGTTPVPDGSFVLRVSVNGKRAAHKSLKLVARAC